MEFFCIWLENEKRKRFWLIFKIVLKNEGELFYLVFCSLDSKTKITWEIHNAHIRFVWITWRVCFLPPWLKIMTCALFVLCTGCIRKYLPDKKYLIKQAKHSYVEYQAVSSSFTELEISFIYFMFALVQDYSRTNHTNYWFLNARNARLVSSY